MTTETVIEKAKAVIEEMRELLAKLEAEKAPKRNWPERIEAGMCFRHIRGIVYLIHLDTGANFGMIGVIGAGKIRTTGTIKWLMEDKDDFEYLGFDALTIRTDAHEPTDTDGIARAALDRTTAKYEAKLAHEPTGAELVGKVCEFSDDGRNWVVLAVCARFDPKDEPFTYRVEPDFVTVDDEDRAWFRFARLAK